MAIKGEEIKITEEGKEKDAFTVTFTNGTLNQLQELKDFLVEEGLEAKDNLDVVKIGIAWLETIKRDKIEKSKSSISEEKKE